MLVLEKYHVAVVFDESALGKGPPQGVKNGLRGDNTSVKEIYKEKDSAAYG